MNPGSAGVPPAARPTATRQRDANAPRHHAPVQRFNARTLARGILPLTLFRPTGEGTAFGCVEISKRPTEFLRLRILQKPADNSPSPTPLRQSASRRRVGWERAGVGIRYFSPATTSTKPTSIYCPPPVWWQWTAIKFFPGFSAAIPAAFGGRLKYSDTYPFG